MAEDCRLGDVFLPWKGVLTMNRLLNQLVVPGGVRFFFLSQEKNIHLPQKLAGANGRELKSWELPKV